jgi:predicted lipoprotein
LETEPGGQGLRDQIYPWPLFNRCEIDQRIVSRGYADPGFPTSLVSARGLGAYEYLVFYEGTDNGCSPGSPINTNGTWAALGATELGKRKAEYAVAIAEEVLGRAGALVRAWDPAAGNFHRELSTAGAGSKTYATDQDALNAITAALFYADNELKDEKLGRPTGTYDCTSPTCPDAVESRWARASGAHVKANLSGFRRVFEGCGDDGSGPGFDDLLRAVGAPQLADRVLAALAAARASADTLPAPFEDLLVSDLGRARALHASVKATTDLLKVEVVTILNLELPKGSEGDND